MPSDRFNEKSLAGEVVAALRELAGGRADMLAEVCGVLTGLSEGEHDEPFARRAAGLCRAAGADPEAIPAWIEEGRRRRENAARPPFSGGMRLACGSLLVITGGFYLTRPSGPNEN